MDINTNPFKNKKAFITGSSRGIGKAIAIQLAQQGCHILLHYRQNREAADQTQKELNKFGIQTWLYQGDLSDMEQTQNMLEKNKN